MTILFFLCWIMQFLSVAPSQDRMKHPIGGCFVTLVIAGNRSNRSMHTYPASAGGHAFTGLNETSIWMLFRQPRDCREQKALGTRSTDPASAGDEQKYYRYHSELGVQTQYRLAIPVNPSHHVAIGRDLAHSTS